MIINYIILAGLGLLLIGVLFWQISLLVSALSGAIYFNARENVIIQALKLAKLQKGENFFDLGCGNGRSLVIASQKFNAQATGIDISAWAIVMSRWNLFRHRTHAKLIWGKIHNTNLQKAEVVYCYLMPNLLQSVEKKLKKELKSGSRVITLAFPITGWRPTKIITAHCSSPITHHSTKIYLYVIKKPSNN